MREKQLIEKGYRIYKIYDFRGERDAKAKAVELRKQGYRATVIETGTRIAGIHDYTVWYKEVA